MGAKYLRYCVQARCEFSWPQQEDASVPHCQLCNERHVHIKPLTVGEYALGHCRQGETRSTDELQSAPGREQRRPAGPCAAPVSSLFRSLDCTDCLLLRASISCHSRATDGLACRPEVEGAASGSWTLTGAYRLSARCLISLLNCCFAFLCSSAGAVRVA